MFKIITGLVAVVLGGCSGSTADATLTNENLEYNYRVGEIDNRVVHEFKTVTGTVCILIRGLNGTTAVSCSFEANQHAK